MLSRLWYVTCSVPPSYLPFETDDKGSGNLRTAVQLPEGEDLNEWIAVHGQLSSVVDNNSSLISVVDFFNHVNMLYGTISEFCTPEKVSSAR